MFLDSGPNRSVCTRTVSLSYSMAGISDDLHFSLSSWGNVPSFVHHQKEHLGNTPSEWPLSVLDPPNTVGWPYQEG